MFTNPNVDSRKKKKLRFKKGLLTAGLGERQAQKSLKILGITLDFELKL